MSSTKPQIHNVLHSRQITPSHGHWYNMYGKFSKVWTLFRDMRGDGQTDRQKDRQTDKGLLTYRHRDMLIAIIRTPTKTK